MWLLWTSDKLLNLSLCFKFPSYNKEITVLRGVVKRLNQLIAHYLAPSTWKLILSVCFSYIILGFIFFYYYYY